MRQSNHVIKKELIQLITVFLFSFFITMGSIMRSNILKGRDHASADLAAAFVFALLITVISLIMIRYYKKEMEKAKKL